MNMLLMGDGYKHDGGSTTTGFDRRSGAGRTHLHYPAAGNIGSPNGTARSFNLAYYYHNQSPALH